MPGCTHKNEQYFYQVFYVAGDKRRHWLKFCGECRERTSHPWCSKPSNDIQTTARPFKGEAW